MTDLARAILESAALAAFFAAIVMWSFAVA